MQNPVPLLRTLNILEATSYVLLAFVARPLKYGWDLPLLVKILGWIHGILFALFCWALVRVVHGARWRPLRIIGVFIAALVPLVPFFVDRRFPVWIAEWKPPAGAGSGDR